MPVGMFSSAMAWSLTWSRCLTRARSELPWATIRTGPPGPAQVRDDGVIPVRQEAAQHVLQALGPRPGLRRQGGVTRITGLGQRVVVGHGRRRHVVGAAPQHELLVAELLPDGRLVLALQRAVVPL